jgi:3-dehydroquinate synthase
LTEDLPVLEHFHVESQRARNGAYRVDFNHDMRYADYAALGTHFLVDANVTEHLGGVLPNMIVIEATENNKKYENIAWIIETLVSKRLRRDSRLVVIGGGVTQDIGCWIASTYMRGIEWTFVPTTLLAQADSCIGSKSSINFGDHKNLLGTFYPPKVVVINRNFLSSLSQHDVRSGTAEIVKLMIIAGYAPELIEQNLQDLDEALYDALMIKRRYIEIDEFDKGPRNLLNYGHCFGHAIESATNYAVPHGIAVAMGMDIANLYSDRLYGGDNFARYHGILSHLYSDHLNINLNVDTIIQAMNHDKKNTANKVNIIMPKNDNIEKVALDNNVDLGVEITELLKIFKDQYARL